MRQFRFLLPAAALVAAIVPSIGFADALSPFIGRIDNSVSIGFLDTHVGYGEHTGQSVSTPYFDTDEGDLTGGAVDITGLGNQNGIYDFYTQLSASLVRGNLAYNGAIQNTQTNTTTPLQEPQHSRYVDYEVRLGQGGPMGRGLMIPYVAIGHHEWFRGQDATAAASWDYTEDYQNAYAGIGLLLQIPITRSMVLGIDASGGRTFNATIDAPALGVSTNLGGSPWGRVGASLDFWLTPNLSFYTKASYTAFDYGQSPIVVTPNFTGYEPFSRTELIRYQAGFRFFYY